MDDSFNIETLSNWGIPYGKLFFIAGPCSAETEEQVWQTAQALKDAGVNVMRSGLWKPRTRPGSFEGVGSQGLKWLKAAGKAIDVAVTTEVASPKHVDECLKQDIDILWIGARTTTNPFAVQAIADALKGVDIPVFVKNPVNPDSALWIGALERIERAGIKRLGAIHRGFSTYELSKYRNIPIWRIPIELKQRIPKLPLICDPSHICGNRELLLSVAQYAVDLLFDGLMLEVHIDPATALSDAQQQLSPEAYRQLTNQIIIKRVRSDHGDYTKHINGIRKNIDAIDKQILALLGERMAYVEKIAFHKKRNNITLFQPDRWEEIITDRKIEGKSHDLSEKFVAQIYQFIHEESLRVQKEAVNVEKNDKKVDNDC